MIEDTLITGLISAVPFIELRGAVPYGIICAGLNPITIFLVAVVVNIVIIPAIFLFLDLFLEEISKFSSFGKIVRGLMDKAHERTKKYVDSYGVLGLTLFVAIPLPVTGAYTGTLAAYVLEMDRKRAMLAIATGVIIAGIIVTLLSTVFYHYTSNSFLSHFLGRFGCK